MAAIETSFFYKCNDINDKCIIKDDYIYRKDHENEKGTYMITDNKLIIYWEGWLEETFNMLDSKFYFDKNNIDNIMKNE